MPGENQLFTLFLTQFTLISIPFSPTDKSRSKDVFLASEGYPG